MPDKIPNKAVLLILTRMGDNETGEERDGHEWMLHGRNDLHHDLNAVFHEMLPKTGKEGEQVTVVINYWKMEDGIRTPHKGQADFHAHLDGCLQCRNEPFNMCPVGQLLLEATGTR